MGKYASGLADLKKTEGEVNVEIIKTRMLQAVANELAEQNRLKRLELRMTWSRQADDWKKYSGDTLDKIQEDMAL
jgi:hypothetical protein